MKPLSPAILLLTAFACQSEPSDKAASRATLTVQSSAPYDNHPKGRIHFSVRSPSGEPAQGTELTVTPTRKLLPSFRPSFAKPLVLLTDAEGQVSTPPMIANPPVQIVVTRDSAHFDTLVFDRNLKNFEYRVMIQLAD